MMRRTGQLSSKQYLYGIKRVLCRNSLLFKLTSIRWFLIFNIVDLGLFKMVKTMVKYYRLYFGIDKR